jgi:hypothetical protein
MPMVVRAYPLHVSPAELDAFAIALARQHAKDTDAFYRRFGVQHESWHLQDFAGVPWVICCTQLREPAAAAESYGRSSEAFDTWFKQQVLKLTGVDPNETPLGPASRQVFSWTDPGTVSAPGIYRTVGPADAPAR